MARTPYSLQNLLTNTAAVRGTAKPLITEAEPQLQVAFERFDRYLASLEALPGQLHANVRFISACKFMNHLWSTYLLAESGLVVDAVLCARNAIEVLAFKWLVDLDPNAAPEYNDNDEHRPVAVRKRLAKLGADITFIERTYAHFSAVTHVGRAGLNLQSSPTGPNGWQLHFGGRSEELLQRQLLQLVCDLLLAFENPHVKKKHST